MNNYSSWGSVIQTPINTTVPMVLERLVPQGTSAAINWNFPQPMQVQIITQLNVNHYYQQIVKELLEKFFVAASLGIGYTEHYYDTNAMISIQTHQGSNNLLHEMIGFLNFKNKLSEMGINVLRCQNLTYTAQPVGKNSLLTTVTGKAEFNNIYYTIIITFVIRIQSGIPKIINEMIDIFQ